MITYVCGLLFSEDRSIVAMIEKLKPSWMAGKLNAIGGKIEPGETPLQAMVREFKEEAGVDFVGWQELAVLTGDNFQIHFFCGFDDIVFSVQQMEEEYVGLFDVHDLLHLEEIMPNLPVMFALALDDSGIAKPVALQDLRAA